MSISRLSRDSGSETPLTSGADVVDSMLANLPKANRVSTYSRVDLEDGRTVQIRVTSPRRPLRTGFDD